MKVSQRLTQRLEILGINAEERQAAKNLLTLVHQVAFWETDSVAQQDEHIPKLSQQFHAGVLNELNNQKEARLNAFTISLDAIEEFNKGSSLGAMMAQAISHAAGQEQSQKEANREKLYQEIQDEYSDYLSSVGLEIVNSGRKEFSVHGMPLPETRSADYQSFMDKVNDIIDTDKTFIPEDEKDRALVKFIESLPAELEAVPAIKKDKVASTMLFDYFVNQYSDQGSTVAISSASGSLTTTPKKVTLNILDGKKLAAFLAEINPNQVDGKLQKQLEAVRDTVLDIMQEPFMKGIDHDAQQRRLEGLYSGIRQFRAIENHLERLGVDTSELKEYIKYSEENILPQFVIVKENDLTLRHDSERENFVSFMWHGDSSLEIYQSKMDGLVHQLRDIGSVAKATQLHQECVSAQVANLEFAIQDMQSFLSGKEAKYCWESKEIIGEKLKIAQATLEQIKPE